MKRKSKLFCKAAACTMSIALLASMTSCSFDKKETKSKGKIAVITMSQQLQYWDFIKMGAVDAGEELGYEISYDAPKDETQVDAQINLVQKAIDEKVKAIAIAPINANDLNDVMRKADEAGIDVITLDSDVTYSGRKSYIGSNNFSAGQIIGREALNLIGRDEEEPKIAIIGHDEKGAANRVNGFKKAMTDATVSDEAVKQGAAKFAPKVLKPQYCNGSEEKAEEQATKLIEENPDIKAFFATNEKSTVGVCKAIDKAGLSGKIKVVGFDTGDGQIAFLKSGTLHGVILQNPYNMGYLGIRYADKAANGEYVPDTIDTGVMVVTKDNLDNPEIQMIIDPESFEKKK